MPEWPDLHVLRARLADALVGHVVTRASVGDPVVIRAARPVDDLLVGRDLRSVGHRGKFLTFGFDADTRVVVDPMLAGVFDLVPSDTKIRAHTALSLTFEAAGDLRYRDDKRMGKVYVGTGSMAIPGLDEIGSDLGEALGWSVEEFARRAGERRNEVRSLLMDPTFIAGIGNAYADEILWAAKLHHKRRVRSLTVQELEALRAAIAEVTSRAVGEVDAGLPPQLGTKVRGHMRVRGRAGEPCARCGTRIVRTRHGLSETDFCPACQPPAAGRIR